MSPLHPSMIDQADMHNLTVNKKRGSEDKDQRSEVQLSTQSGN